MNPLDFKCSWCGAARGRSCTNTFGDDCNGYHDSRVVRSREWCGWIVTLSGNLAVAGALYRSFNLGEWCGARTEREGGFWDSSPPWWPNRNGKAAP